MTTSRVHTPKGQTPTGDSGLPEHIYGKAFGTTRSSIRRILLNLGRKETKLLSELQRVLRCNILDAYFIATGALGDHLAFVLLLPNFFLFGFSDVGRVMANLLLYGVVVSSALKDYLCLPRPDSPPVQRLSMNKSHSLEYGFPSTHTTNCVALGLASLSYIISSDMFSFHMKLLLSIGILIYVFSVSFGRIYCGMHSITDVTAGFMLAVALWSIFYLGRDYVDNFIFNSGLLHFALITMGLLSVVYFHPDPVEACPCFEDSVACLGALIGINIGTWRVIHGREYLITPAKHTLPPSFPGYGYTQLALKMFLGLSCIILARLVMKKLCHLCLPPIYRLFKIPIHKPHNPVVKCSIPSTTYIPIVSATVNVEKAKKSLEPRSKTDLHRTMDCTLNRLKDNEVVKKTELSSLQDGEELVISRHNIDVVTKVLVYVVMGWVAAEGNLILCKFLMI